MSQPTQVSAQNAQVAPPPAPGTTPATGTTTYLPVPIPVTPKTQASLPGAILALSLLLVAAFVMKVLWRLPERFRLRQWIQDFGGATAVQNKLLRAVGYIGFVAGFLTGQYVMGILVAGVMMIAVNTRPQSDAERNFGDNG